MKVVSWCPGRQGAANPASHFRWAPASVSPGIEKGFSMPRKVLQKHTVVLQCDGPTGSDEPCNQRIVRHVLAEDPPDALQAVLGQDLPEDWKILKTVTRCPGCEAA